MHIHICMAFSHVSEYNSIHHVDIKILNFRQRYTYLRPHGQLLPGWNLGFLSETVSKGGYTLGFRFQVHTHTKICNVLQLIYVFWEKKTFKINTVYKLGFTNGNRIRVSETELSYESILEGEWFGRTVWFVQSHIQPRESSKNGSRRIEMKFRVIQYWTPLNKSFFFSFFLPNPDRASILTWSSSIYVTLLHNSL